MSRTPASEHYEDVQREHADRAEALTTGEFRNEFNLKEARVHAELATSAAIMHLAAVIQEKE